MKSKKFPYKNSKEYQTKLINRAYMSIGIPLLAFLWTYLELLAKNIKSVVGDNVFYFFATALSFVIAVLVWKAVRQFKKGVREAKDQPELIDKLIIYSSASSRKFFMLFFASAISVAGLYLCASELFAAWFAVVIVVFSFGNPTKERIVDDLRLKDENKKIMLTGGEFYP